MILLIKTVKAFLLNITGLLDIGIGFFCWNYEFMEGRIKINK